jgi:uncharacterized protein
VNEYSSREHSRPDILLVSGEYFNFLEPEKNVFGILEIGHGLSHVCRFGGQCTPFYSVAQHSVIVSYIVAPEFAMDALMHDASEAFIGDMTRPLKKLIPAYKEIEANIDRDMARRFGLRYPMHPEVAWADLVALATEQRDLMPPHDDEWAVLKGIQPLPEKIVALPPDEARALFYRRYQELS